VAQWFHGDGARYADRVYDFWVDATQMPYPDSAKITQVDLDSKSYDCTT
jgi:hypothetical protein